MENPNTSISTERHFRIQEIAKMWGYSRRTMTKLFENEPGVLKLGTGGTLKKRRYLVLSIPESVANRVHRRLAECKS
jgi:CRP-like cAMP-binding protein